MAMRLIDADSLVNRLCQTPMSDIFNWEAMSFKEKISAINMAEFIMKTIRNFPVEDAEKVVRCEECKYRAIDTVKGEDWCKHTLGLAGEVYATDFCCHGVREK